ncbi:MAG: HEAT repeat domain-containing protein, partial [Candidatus Binatia bacterium]
LVRRHVAWALGQIGSPESVEALRRRLEAESDREVKEEIEEALGRRLKTEDSSTPFGE